MRRNPKELETMYRKMSRRTLLLGGGQVAMVAALGMRMRYMQVEQADPVSTARRGKPDQHSPASTGPRGTL